MWSFTASGEFLSVCLVTFKYFVSVRWIQVYIDSAVFRRSISPFWKSLLINFSPTRPSSSIRSYDTSELKQNFIFLTRISIWFKMLEKVLIKDSKYPKIISFTIVVYFPIPTSLISPRPGLSHFEWVIMPLIHHSHHLFPCHTPLLHYDYKWVPWARRERHSSLWGGDYLECRPLALCHKGVGPSIPLAQSNLPVRERERETDNYSSESADVTGRGKRWDV